MTRRLLSTARLSHLALACFFATASVYVAHAQSEVCSSRNNDFEICEDGFTCAYGFGGGDLWERFTMRVTETANENGDMSLIIFFGAEAATIAEKKTESGEALSWTKRSSGEGQSFFRVANTNSNGDIALSFTCAGASTTTTDASDDGDTSIEVADNTLFAVGDSIIVGAGSPTEERNVVTGFGSLQLLTPLQFAHGADETVVSLGPGPTTTSVDSPELIEMQLELGAFPNPARGSANIIVRSGKVQDVEIIVYDVLGRQQAILHHGVLTTGEHQFEYDSTGAAGTYFVNVTTPAGSIARSVVMLK